VTIGRLRSVVCGVVESVMLAELFAFFLFLSLASSTGVALAVDVISGSTHHEIALVGVL